MTPSNMLGFALTLGLLLASASAAAEQAAAACPAPAATRKTTLQRASDDVLRQLRPSGLKRHAQGFGALAKRGYEDVVSKVSVKPAKP